MNNLSKYRLIKAASQLEDEDEEQPRHGKRAPKNSNTSILPWLLPSLAVGGGGALLYANRDNPAVSKFFTNLDKGTKKTFGRKEEPALIPKNEGWSTGKNLGIGLSTTMGVNAGAAGAGYLALNKLHASPDSGYSDYLKGTSNNQSHWDDLFSKSQTEAGSPMAHDLSSGIGSQGSQPHYQSQQILSRHDPKAQSAKMFLNANSNLATAAHEAGHHIQIAKNPGIYNPMYRGVGGLVSNLSAYAPMLSNNEDVGAVGAATGTAASIPELLSEFDAGRRGSNLLKAVTGKGSLRPYAGLPSYALKAAVPLAMHLIKKLNGGYADK